ncbi:MAG: META domain-containing protein [Phycisphaerales bacterium]
MRRARMTISLAAVLALAACAARTSTSSSPTNDKPSEVTTKDSSSGNAPAPESEDKPAHKPEADSNAALASLVGAWRLVSLNGQDITPRLASLSKPPTISFAADAGISGFAGVNRFTGRLDKSGLGGGAFKTSPLAMTRMAGPPDAMQIEGEFATALSKATAFTLEGDRLELRTTASSLAVLERVK